MTKDIFNLLYQYHATSNIEEKVVFAKKIYTLSVGKVEHWKNHSLSDIEGEAWRDKPGWDGMYRISNMGRVYSSERKIIQNGCVPYRIKKALIMRSAKTAAGHISFAMCVNKMLKSELMNRNVYSLFVDENIDGFEINHIDGNKENNCWWNLEKTTSKENQDHATHMGLKSSGENHYMAVLSGEQVLDIFNDKRKLRELAEVHGVSSTCIAAIKTGFSWSTVTGKKYAPTRKMPPR